MSTLKAKKSAPLSKRSKLRLINNSENNILRTEHMIKNNLDVKSFIYQQIAEFQPFVTPTTVAAVVAKDPLKLSHIELNQTKLHRISIHLRDNDSQIHEEAVHENIFEAIRLAKVKLLGRLVEIQDKVISKEDRIEELHLALQNNQKH